MNHSVFLDHMNRKSRIQILIRHAFLGLLCCSFMNTVHAQQKKNSLEFDVLGTAGHYSIHYFHYAGSEKKGLSAGIGFSPSLFPIRHGAFIFVYSPRIPMQVNYYYRSGRHMFEAGAGITPYFENLMQKWYFSFLGNLSYRYDISTKFYVGASFNPVFDFNDNAFYPWGAAKAGWYFDFPKR